MDLNTLKGLSTVLVMITFVGVCWWAFAPSRRKQFNDAANLPFADDVDPQNEKLHPKTDEDKAG
jgi:cytochrome c oxidase cbb3-type subunit IV